MASTRNQRPRQLNEQGPSPQRGNSQHRKPKESSDQSTRKAARSRRSHNQQSAPDETTEIRKAKVGVEGRWRAPKPASPSANERAIPARGGWSTENQRKVRIKSTHARRPATAVVTTQQSAPDETTEIKKPRVGVEGRWRAHEPASPSALNSRGHPRERQQSTESQRKVRIKAPTQGGPPAAVVCSTVSPR